MRSRRKEIKEIKQEVDEITAEMSGARTMDLAPVLGLVQPAAPQAVHMPTLRAALVAIQELDTMEGVVTSAYVTSQEDTAEDWSDIKGVERKDLLALQHAPEFGVPVTALVPAPKAVANASYHLMYSATLQTVEQDADQESRVSSSIRQAWGGARLLYTVLLSLFLSSVLEKESSFTRKLSTALASAPN